MMTADQIARQSSEERSAWLASLNDDETAIVHSAVGNRYTLVFVSLVKRLLAAEMEPAYRLRFLEWLDKCADNWLTPEAIAAVDPMCDDGFEMVHEARKLGAGKMFDVFARWEVFNAFVALNPSLLTAIKMPRAVPSQKERVTMDTKAPQQVYPS
jgi:hypothetical protein